MKGKKKNTENDISGKERFARNLASAITGTQARLSTKLNAYFSRLDRRTQVTLLATVITAMAAYSLYLILLNIL